MSSEYGEYDNYDYRSAEETTLEEQIESARKALAAVIRLSETGRSDYLDKKKTEIELRLEHMEKIKQIQEKLGFSVQDYEKLSHDAPEEVHERDNIPNPFDRLSLEELLFLRENNYFLPKKQA